ncbi:iron chaperone [Subtercola lobariae]|uniref:YdhG-like domain-containing protein n=1 Tax=Subtercola lobariae TaxID=1588641 RepID=A0A917F3G3_9MICO|nr:DUF1801 domain-containing protein [Subtercola lobariae]GGF39414.1 hypothetical protein GCM10011399_35390 [Subtercola lobariae]
MANEVTDYINEQPEPERSRIAALYAHARDVVAEATEGVSYGMPALLYKGKGLVAVMNTKKHIGIYPFGGLAELADDVTAAGLESTTGSIHLGDGQSLPPELFDRFLLRRKARLDER